MIPREYLLGATSSCKLLKLFGTADHRFWPCHTGYPKGPCSLSRYLKVIRCKANEHAKILHVRSLLAISVEPSATSCRSLGLSSSRPERLDCPGSEFLQKLVSLFRHAYCSTVLNLRLACYRPFTDLSESSTLPTLADWCQLQKATRCFSPQSIAGPAGRTPRRAN